MQRCKDEPQVPMSSPACQYWGTGKSYGTLSHWRRHLVCRNTDFKAFSCSDSGRHSISQTPLRHISRMCIPGTILTAATNIWKHISECTLFHASTPRTYLVRPVMLRDTGDGRLMKSRLPAFTVETLLSCPLVIDITERDTCLLWQWCGLASDEGPASWQAWYNNRSGTVAKHLFD